MFGGVEGVVDVCDLAERHDEHAHHRLDRVVEDVRHLAAVDHVHRCSRHQRMTSVHGVSASLHAQLKVVLRMVV